MGPRFDTRVLSEIVGQMRAYDDRLYTKFISALNDYATELTVAVTECPLPEMQEARGRAQQARKFLQVCSEPRAPR